MDGISGRLYVREHPDLTLVPEPVTSAPYAVAVRADDRSLLRAVDAALEAMAADGALETILGRFF